MNSRYLISGLPAMAVAAIVSVASVQDVQAQQGGPWARMQNADEAIKKGDWQKAYDEISAAVTVFDKRSKQLNIGDRFGHFWYVKGLCEMHLNENEKAIESFKSGLEKYPGPGNPSRGAAYLKLAEAAIALNDFDQALGYLNSFIEFRIKNADTLSPIDKEINMGLVYALAAQCNFRAQNTNFEEGLKNIKLIAENRYRGAGIPDAPIINAFLSMVEKSIIADRPEIALDFLKDNRSIVALEPWRVSDFGLLFLKYAKDARDKYGDSEGEKAANMLKLSHELLTLVPDQAAVDQSVKDTLARMGTFEKMPDSTIIYDKKVIQKIQSDLAETIKTHKQPPAALVLMMTAADYVESGAYRQARSAYHVLNDNYKELDPVSREANMYYLATMSTAIGELDEAQKLAGEFRKEYPNSELTKNMDVMSLNSLFSDGKFEDALKLAQSITSGGAADPATKELAMFVEGAALFSLDRFRDSIPKLQAFVEEFPDSDHAPQAMYYTGAALKRTGSMDRSVHAYDKFLRKYPDKGDSPFLPFAIYDQAQACVQLATPDNEKKALDNYDRLIKDFPDSPLIPATWVGRGFLLQEKLKKPEEAIASYQKAAETATVLDDKTVLGEALYRLTSNAVKNKQYKEAAEYYDTFWKEVSNEDSVYFRLNEAVEGLAALTELDRKKEGMERLEKMIVAVSRVNPDQDNPVLEAAVNSYTTAYLKDMAGADGKGTVNLEQAKNHYYNFPGVQASDVNLITTLRIALVGIYESELKKIDKADTAGIAALAAQVQVIFQDIQRSLDIKTMTPFALIKLANHLAEKTDHPETAIPYYQELLTRPANKYTNDANFGMAQALSRNPDKAEAVKAIAMMEKVISDEKAKPRPDNRILEKANYYLALFYFNTGDYAKAAELGYKYLVDYQSGQYALDATMLCARAFDQAGNVDSALQYYNRVNDNYTGAIGFSAPAVKRAMELYFQRNNPKPDLDRPSDKLLAYRMGNQFIRLTQPSFDLMTFDDRAAWRETEALVQQFAADPEIAEENRVAEERAKARAEASKR